MFQDNPGKPVPECLLDFIGTKDDGGGDGDNGRKTCEALVKSNKHRNFYKLNALPVARAVQRDRKYHIP